MKKLIVLFAILFISFPAWCATYYVDGAAADDSGDGSVGSPKKYIESGIALVSAGDTLIIADGTYSTTSDQITGIPNGSAGSYVTIQAETDGGVIITATNGLGMAHDDAYITITGINFAYAGGKSILGNHIKLLRCSFVGGPSTGSGANATIGTSDYSDTQYILLEDCYSYGDGGRYNFLIYNSDYVVLRRCVARHDGGYTGIDPEAGFNAYSSSHVIFQNCIAIDCDLGSYTSWYSGFYATEDGAESDVQWQGCISLNNDNGLLHVDPKYGGSLTDFVFNNCALYDANGALSWVSSFGSSGSATGTMTNITAGGAANGWGEWGTRTISATNCILFDISGNKVDGSVTASYCALEGGGEACSDCQTYDPLTNGLLYLPQIESDGDLKTDGESGGQIGATILKKIGTSGTLYGESGYDTVTEDDLWPWPYEDRIKTDMEAVSDRGFTAYSGLDGTHNTLTSYIWEYLGNQMPADIYGESPSTPTIRAGGIRSGGIR